ncbi:MAG: type II toxin-antitoxin system VapC family toxin [Planctomycetes bacterium]|nr:type II toxin-antitoxin system VapC family toxin [Planctomycetota bacterium]
MNPTFIDTSHLLALVLKDDAFHERAKEWDRAIVSPLVTTEYVLVEFADALAKTPLRTVTHQTILVLRRNPRVTVVPGSSNLIDRGLDLYSARPDKQWSLTDCISFSVMQENEASDALTADRHFEQAGFRALLRMPVESRP